MIEDYSPSPCRVIVSRGHTVGGTRAATVIDAPPPQVAKSGVRCAGRPRVANPKKPPIKRPGAGKGCRMHHVSIERIRALQAQGMNAPKIAAELKCSVDLIFDRLRKAPDPDGLLLCPCGAKKIANRPLCRACRKTERLAGKKGK